MNNTAPRVLRIAAITLAAIAFLLAAYFAWLLWNLPTAQFELPAEEGFKSAPPLPLPDEKAWQVFRARQGSGESSGDDGISRRFRLAGTFFLFADGDESETRRAVVDDLQQKRQLIVKEGDTIEEFEVAHIDFDRVLLRSGGLEYLLALSFSAATVERAAVSRRTPSEEPSMEDLPPLETTRFGKRVGENRWVIRRDELLRFYAEVMEDPERIANIYASLKPKIEEGEIGGYRVDPEGEEAFFEAVGLRQGDVIRRVNSMRMVSQRRGEYFLSEFLKNRISALVIDVERGGREEKLIYLIR